MFLWVAGSNGGIEFLDPRCIGRERGRTILCERDFFEPSVQVFLAEFVGVPMTINLIDTVKHVEQALSLEGNGEVVVNHVQQDVGSFLVWGSDGKIVDLSFEDNVLASDHT